MENQLGKHHLINVIRNKILNQRVFFDVVVEEFQHLALSLNDLEVAKDKLKAKIDRLANKIYLQKSELKEIERKTNLKTLRKVFDVMIGCLERPMKNYEYQIETLGIDIISPMVEEEFDSNFHEPVQSSTSSYIKRTVRKGYAYQGTCLRPALVELKEGES